MISGACLVVASGCALRGNTELLESQLRKQEYQHEQLAADLERTREELRVARADAQAVRAQMAARGQPVPPAESADALYRAKQIRFQKLMTGGWNQDGLPGDEGLSVLITPVDAQGDLVKLPGAIEIELTNPAVDAQPRELGRWRFSEEEAWSHWHKGIFSAGYLLRVHWQQPPPKGELTLSARMLCADGRTFDAITQISVDPPVESAAQEVTRDAPARPARNSSTSQRPKAEPATVDATPLPSDRALETSDNWTDQTIPRLR
jgi:hypothetical protein